jgi:hypothetical protein
MPRIELTFEQRLAHQRLCKLCDQPLEGSLKKKLTIAVQLFGLKPGYKLCRCSQTIFGPEGTPIDWEIDEWQQVRSIMIRRKSK